MILDLQKTADHISGWIRDYAKNAGVKSLVLGLSGGIDSALVSLLCKRTGISTICAYMGCNSSASSYERASTFALEQGLPLFVVNLDYAHQTIVEQFKSPMSVKDVPGVSFDWSGNGSMGGLRSCLRAPTLSYLSHASNGLIIGTGNKSEDHLIRYFQKFGDGCIDLSPISDLFKTEVRELFKYLAEQSNNGVMGQAAQKIYDAKPSADLFEGHEDEKELGITYDEIEWGDRLNSTSSSYGDTADSDGSGGIICSSEDPTKHPSNAWQALTARQQFVISKMWAMEKSSRHKINSNLPCCELRKVPGLVR